MPAASSPAAEVEVDEGLVRSLLGSQHPDLAHLELVPLAEGWDNVVYRLGPDLTVRLPRRAMSAALVEHELRWLPELAPVLPLPIPVPVRAGRPDDIYPFPWTVCRWIDGDVVRSAPSPLDLPAAADDLGVFLAALHRPAPPDAPRNPYRGVPLADRDEVFRARVEMVADTVATAPVLAEWEAALRVPRWERPGVWLHGDLHPNNILVADGRVSGVIDFVDLCAGDPATDLSLAWMLFPPELRPRFRAAAGTVDDPTWARARGWALLLGISYVAGSADNPEFGAVGQRVVDAVLADG